MRAGPGAGHIARWLPAAVIALVLCHAVWFYGRFPYDDAFIFMRIARRFAETGEPYFNAHERVLGHSSHLWLLLMTLLFKLWGPGLGPVKVMAAGSLVASLVLTIQLLRSFLPALLATAIAGFLVVVFLAPSGALLMEAPLAVALLLATLLAIERGRDGRAGLCAGLAAGTRYELVLLVPLAFIVVKDRRAFLRGVAGPLVVFLGFALGFFRTVVPLPVIAKDRVYQGTIEPLLLSGLHGAGWSGTTGALFGYLVFALLVGGLALHWGSIARARSGPTWPWVAVTQSSMILFAYIARESMVFPWYWPLITFPLSLSAIALIPQGGRGWIVAGLPLLCFRPLVSAGLDAAEGYVLSEPARHREVGENSRTLEYLALGERLHRESPEAHILAPEIGGLGWAFYPGHVSDALALVSPENLKFHPLKVPEERRSGGVGAVPVGAVQEGQPDLVVAMECDTEAFRRAVADGALPNYRLRLQEPVVPRAVQEQFHVSGVVWGARYTEVYERVP
jgi:hypothetical protein